MADKGQTATDFFKSEFTRLLSQKTNDFQADYLPAILAMRTLENSNLVLQAMQGFSPTPVCEEMVNVGFRTDEEEHKRIASALVNADFPSYGVTLKELGQAIIQIAVSDMSPTQFTETTAVLLMGNAASIQRAYAQDQTGQDQAAWNPSL